MAPKERNWRSGTRARIVAPGFGIDGKTGTVEFDTTSPASALVVRLDNGKRAVVGTNQAVYGRKKGQGNA